MRAAAVRTRSVVACAPCWEAVSTSITRPAPPASPEAVIGKNAPPAMPSIRAMIDWAMLACSAVRASRAMTNISEVPAATAQTTTTATATGEPNDTPKKSEPAMSSTPVATTPRTKLTIPLAATMRAGRIGIERSRASVPCWRSATSPSTPKPTVKSRKRPAWPATRAPVTLSCSFDGWPGARLTSGARATACWARDWRRSSATPAPAPAAAATAPACKRSSTPCTTERRMSPSMPAPSPSVTSTTAPSPRATAGPNPGGTTMARAASPDRAWALASSAESSRTVTSSPSTWERAATMGRARGSSAGAETATLTGSSSRPVAPPKIRLKTNMSARGTARAKIRTDRSRTRWRRSDIVMTHSGRMAWCTT